MFPEEKLDVIRSFLKEKFSNYSVRDYWDFDSEGQTFFLEGEDRRLTFSRNFLDDSSTSDISMFLEREGQELG